MSAVFVVAVVAIVAAVRARNCDQCDPLRAAAYSARKHSDRPLATAGAAGTAERSALRVHLDDWVDAGLIDPATADAIERHELAHEFANEAAPTSRVPLAAEAVGYLGGGLLFAAVAMVTGNNWDTLAVPARVAVLAVPTCLATVAGSWIGRNEAESLQRLGSLLWALAVMGVAATAGEVWYDVVHDADPPEAGSLLFPAAAAAVAAAVLWGLRRHALQVVVLFVATVATTAGLVEASRPGDGDVSALAVGLALLALAVAWTVGGLFGRLTPTLPVLVLGPALALVAAQTLRDETDDLGLWVGIGVAVTLLAVGAARPAVTVLLVGTVGLFQWTPQIALHYLGDRLGAEITLALIGLLLLGLAGSMIRLWPRLRSRTARSER